MTSKVEKSVLTHAPAEGPFFAAADVADSPEDIAYDPNQWAVPTYQHSSLNEAISNGIDSQGIHQIAIGNRSTIDLYSVNLDRINTRENRVILISFTSAIAERDGKPAPFFSGLGLATDLDLPTIAIADPTLALSPDLALAWYAGNQLVPDLSLHIARLLDGLAEKYRSRLLIIGGSGAGFAGLVLSTLLECSATIVVWNPQTSVTEYVPQAVASYIETAFPAQRNRLAAIDGSTDTAALRTCYREVLDAEGIIHDVRERQIKNNVDLLYLQNQSDWHVAAHAAPYLAKHCWTRRGNAIFSSKDSNILYIVGEWGEGHAAPARAMLTDILSQIAQGISLDTLVELWSTGIPANFAAPSRINWLAVEDSPQVHISVNTENALIKSHCELRGVTSTAGYTYAFYLLLDGKRVAMRWYEASNEVIFDLPAAPGNLELIAFARDRLAVQVQSSVSIN